MKSSLAEQLYGRKVINTINKEVFVPNKDVSKIAMDAYNNFYGNLTDESEKFCKDIWSKYPFSIFDPKTPFFKHKKSSQAIETRDLSFFIRGTQAAFFPDKSEDEVLEAKRLAMNRGISSLNLLCKSNLPEYSNFFEIPKIHSPFNPMEIMSNAKEKWKIARQGMHRYSKHPELMYEAFNVARSWGLGYIILMIDESPDIFNSIHYRKLIGKSLWQQFDFKNPKQVSDNLFSWDTKFGVKVYGTEKEPFRQRAKIHDDNQNIKYHSLLMKMTLTQKFIEQIYDTYGVEFIVDNDKEIRKLMSLFNLEKYEHIEKTEPPRFFCDKFIVRVPVRVDSSIQSNSQEKWATLRRPIEKYIRIPVEMQIRPIKTLSKTDHELYKKQQFQNVFPIWYPDSIYTPLIVKSIDE